MLRFLAWIGTNEFAMRRDLVTIMAVLLISGGIAAAANVVGHKMDWIRRPLDPPSVPGSTQSAPSESSQATQSGPAGTNGPTTHPGTAVVPAAAVLEHLAHGTAYFVDAREAEEYTAGHLRGAVNVPSSAIYANIEKVTSMVPLDQLVIVYCGGGGCEAGHNVADALRRDFGYANVAVHEKGWEEIESSDQFHQCIVAGEAP